MIGISGFAGLGAMPLAAALRTIDGIVVVIYLACMLALGFFFANRSKDTEQYFVASRSYKGWVLGISMLSTTISSITFLAFPAAAFALDWRLVVNNLMWPVGMILAVWIFIPFFRRGRATTAFEYLDERYGPIASLYGAISYIVSQVFRIGIVLYLVSLAISTLTGYSITSVILVTGLIISCYTVAGGIEGVIWTDVVQAFMLWGGGIVCLVLIVVKLPGGFGQIMEVGAANNKFYMGDTSFDMSHRTLWTMLILGLWASVGNFIASQDVVQRYIAAKSTREARKGAIVGALLSVPTWIFFFFIGTALWVYYHVNPNPEVAKMEADRVLSYFILNNFPVGITGFVVAAIISAAMSSLDSSINGLSTVMVTNIIRKYISTDRSELFYLRWARVIGCISGGIMILGALIFSMIPDNESVVNMQFIIFALFGGCITGFFLLGFLTTRVSYTATVISLAAAILLNLYLIFNSIGWLPQSLRVAVHEYWVSILVNTFFIIFAYIISFIWPRRHKDISGLTIWTVDKTAPQR